MPKQVERIQQAIAAATNRGDTERDEQMLAFIEATLRDALGQKHGVWRWRCHNHMDDDGQTDATH